VVYCGPVARAEVHSVYDNADVLLLLLGTGRYVTSGKVFEYVSTGLPIVSVHDPGNAASEILRGYPLWFPVERLDAESVAKALGSAGQAARTADHLTRAAALEFAEQYRRARQLAPRLAALKAAVRSRVDAR
jgi:glycosyltransferase involved in cell wall biosynthesis